MAIVIPGILAVGSLAYTWMQSEEAKAVDGRTQKQTAEALATLERNIKMPDLDPAPITLEQYNLIRKFNPELAVYVKEKMPQIITEGDSAYVKQVQTDALKDMVSLSKTGGDATYKAEMAQAEFDAQQARKSQLTDTLRAYGNRGMSGGGAELLANVASAQQMESSQRLAGLNAAAGSQDRRMQALQGVANQSGQIRNQNYQTEAANTSVINSFNERAARTVNEQNEFRVKTLNDADKYNLENEQNINNSNVDVRNKNKIIARDRADMVERVNREANNEFEYSKANLRTGQAAQQRQADQDGIARNNAMANQFMSSAGQLAGAYTKQQERAEDREERKAGYYVPKK